MTLDPNGLSIKLQDDFSLGEKTFLDRSITFNPLEKGAGIPKSLLKADLTFRLVIAGELKLNAGMKLTKAGSGIEYVSGTDSSSDGTFVRLTAVAAATASAGVDVEVLKGFAGAIAITISGTGTLNLSSTARFSGQITSPELVPPSTFVATLGLGYRVQAFGTLLKKLEVFSYDSDDPKNGGPAAHQIKPIDLFAITKMTRHGKNPKPDKA